MFAVPKPLISRALGKDAENLRRMSEVFKRRVRIVPIPFGENDAKEFFSKIIEPIEFKDLEITGGEIVINAGQMNKAALIGRNKRRLFELQKIAKDFFGKELKII
jgi:transcription antitermination factor NusA-like protein